MERNHRDISRIAGICWKELDEEDKQVWKDRAARLSEEHRRQNPNYVFKPAARRPRASKPKSQTLVAKEERCRALASKVIADSVAANQPVENTASPSPPPYTPAEITYHSDFSHIAPNLQVMAPKPVSNAFHPFSCEQMAHVLSPLIQMRPVTPETLSPMVGTPPLLFQYDLPAFNNQENPQAVISSPYMDFSAYPPFPAYSTSTSTDVALPETEMWNAYTTFDHQGLATFQSPDVSSPLSYVQSPTSSVSEFSPISTEAPYTQLPGSELAGLEAFIEYCSPPAAFSQLDEDFLLYPY